MRPIYFLSLFCWVFLLGIIEMLSDTRDKGSRKNNFTESALIFRLGSVDIKEQKAQ